MDATSRKLWLVYSSSSGIFKRASLFRPLPESTIQLTQSNSMLIRQTPAMLQVLQIIVNGGDVVGYAQ